MRVYRCLACGYRAEWPRIEQHVNDQHPGWGGPRPGSGRRPTGKALRSLTVRLSPEQIERLRELGNGNASAGVRRALEENRGLRGLLMSRYQGEYRYVSEAAIDEALLMRDNSQ
jgi:hypothetical protein